MDRRRWPVLSAVSVGTFMATLDGSIVNIALPSVGEALGIDLGAIEWVLGCWTGGLFVVMQHSVRNGGAQGRGAHPRLSLVLARGRSGCWAMPAVPGRLG